MPRLFTGLEIPEDIAFELNLMQGGVWGARWIDASDYHITLRFMGDIEDRLAHEIRFALERVASAPFSIRLKGVGAFGGADPRSIYAGVEVMHSRGTPATMHKLPPAPDIMHEVTRSLRSSVHMAERRGVKPESIVVDPGIGFGKSQEQNIELIAKLDQLIDAFPEYPLLIGTSRKSFIGRILADADGNPAPADQRLHGTMASVTAAVLKGAHIVRVHDVKASIESVLVAEALVGAK